MSERMDDDRLRSILRNWDDTGSGWFPVVLREIQRARARETELEAEVAKLRDLLRGMLDWADGHHHGFCDCEACSVATAARLVLGDKP